MRDATTGMTKLCGPSAPNSVYVTLQEVGLMVWDQTVTVSGLRSLALPFFISTGNIQRTRKGVMAHCEMHRECLAYFHQEDDRTHHL